MCIQSSDVGHVLHYEYAIDVHRVAESCYLVRDETPADPARRRVQRAATGSGMRSRNPTNSDGAGQPLEPEAVTELQAGLGGCWLVTTRTSRHVWNLDQMTYQRLPGPDGHKFVADGMVLPLTRIGVYPAVGRSSLVFYDDPENEQRERWRVSATVVSITRLETEDADQPDPDGVSDA